MVFIIKQNLQMHAWHTDVETLRMKIGVEHWTVACKGKLLGLTLVMLAVHDAHHVVRFSVHY